MSSMMGMESSLSKGDRRLSFGITSDLGPGGYMQLWRRHARTFAGRAVFFWAVTILGFAQNPASPASPAPTPKHFDHVLIVVLENQDYESAIQNDLLKSRSEEHTS